MTTSRKLSNVIGKYTNSKQFIFGHTLRRCDINTSTFLERKTLLLYFTIYLFILRFTMINLNELFFVRKGQQM